MDGDIELGGYLVRVAVIHAFGQSVFGRVDKQYRGLASASLFEFAAAAAVAGVVAVLPVDEFVDEGAAFARVGDAPVDEHGVGGEAVYARRVCRAVGRWPRAGLARPDTGSCASAHSSCAATTAGGALSAIRSSFVPSSSYSGKQSRTTFIGE